MKTKIGLWIDHKKANIVTLTDNEEAMGLVISKVERQPSRSGDSPLKGKHEVFNTPSDDHKQRALTQHLNHYYDAIAAHIKDAKSILIFGPGEAKNEFKKHLIKNHFGGHIAELETADKMSNYQISSKVKKYFSTHL